MASVSLILISSIVSGMSFSRYEVMQNLIGNNNKFGNLVFNVTKIPNDNQSVVLPLNEITPDSSKTYTFSITNFDGNTQSHLPFEYEIEVETYGNLPITVQIASKSLTTNSGVAATTVSGKGTVNSPVNISTKGKMYVDTSSAKQKYEHEYNVTISWPKSTDADWYDKYSTEVEYLSISVIASQLAPDYS